MIETIEGLLRYIYPLTPPPDILTRENHTPPIPHIRDPQAMAAIAQAQRINRDNDYDSSGLCEFHIGLIYIYWRDFSGAGQQFALARRQWRFVNRQTAVCLTYFVEGYTQESNFAYETALITYKRAARCLLTLPESDFTNALRRELTDARNRTRHLLATVSSPPPYNPASEQPTQPTESSVHHTHQSEVTMPVKPPISNIHPIHLAGSQAETTSPASDDDVPVPQDNMHQKDLQTNTPPPQYNMNKQEDDDIA